MLRDQDSIEKLAKRLPNIKRAVLVGNGGIALEVAFAFTGVEVGHIPHLDSYLPMATQVLLIGG